MKNQTRAEKREQKKRKMRHMKVSGASVKKLRKLQLSGADPVMGSSAPTGPTGAATPKALMPQSGGADHPLRPRRLKH